MYLEIAALEDKIKILKDKWLQMIEQRGYTIAKRKDDKKNLLKLIMILVSTDPTKNKEYLQWLLVKGTSSPTWRNKKMMAWHEDLMSIREDLETYHRLKLKKKLKPEHRDINKLKDDVALWDVLQEYSEISTETDKEVEKQFYAKKEATLFFDNSEWKIVIPHTEKASCYFGINTRWCTAGKNDNAFEDYNSYGNLYILLNKKQNKT